MLTGPSVVICEEPVLTCTFGNTNHVGIFHRYYSGGIGCLAINPSSLVRFAAGKSSAGVVSLDGFPADVWPEELI